MSTEDPKPSQTYPGSCHCGRVTFKVKSPPLSDPAAGVASCNCSICSRHGYIFIYVPHADLTFDKGSFGELTQYTFGSHRMGHYFCPTCGTSCFAKSLDPTFYGEHTAVNVRALHDVDLKSLTMKEHDGKSI
ncbi:glutathione-dependent formaldehyde-activating enzyme [Lindgomyces ingoldianus]|uniref:Glutathione-dependent formaldehyde-activating enzyme n=1 Tax=Lindgomyces ingoldianus TaxID=673940 RepID=A0ACB6QN93_9PLEO|nr:glutathione-dependent formaldehyde-activating enzyme [Lindgomyces ingoldianus]KAF2468053.1 glutathione-dependent formaldehyde-activating enzyme [Lindgomyces ingoldianus]